MLPPAAAPVTKKKAFITPSLEFVNPTHANEFSLSYEPETSIAKPPIDDGCEFQTESISFA